MIVMLAMMVVKVGPEEICWVLLGWGKQFMAIDLNFSKCFNQNAFPYKWENITMCILEKIVNLCRRVQIGMAVPGIK